MGALDKTLVTTGKPKVSGAVYVAAADSANAPTDATTTLNAEFISLGYVSEDGVKNNNSPEMDTANAWGGVVVLGMQTAKPDEWSFKLISTMDVDVLKTVYGEDNVTGSLSAGITVKANTKQLDAKCWVIDMLLRDGGMKRIVIPHGEITEIGEMVYSDEEIFGYELTITAMPDANGDTHKEYIIRS